MHTMPTEPKHATKRQYWMDYLRMFLSVNVVVSHCMGTYVNSNVVGLWSVSPPVDKAARLLYNYYGGATHSYNMALYFMLAGYLTPRSFQRRGPWKYLWDRTLRLLVPCLIFSLLVMPIILYISLSSNTFVQYLQEAADDSYDEDSDATPPQVQVPTLADAFREYYFGDAVLSHSSGNSVAGGPVWFIYMLWWFSVAYTVIRMIAASSPVQSCKQAVLARFERASNSTKKSSSTPLPTTRQDGTGGSKGSRVSDADAVVNVADNGIEQFTLRQLLVWGAVIVLGLTGVCFAVLMIIAAINPDIAPEGYVTIAFITNFEASLLPLYVTGFALGIWAYYHDAFRRLPSSICYWCLCISALWYTAAWALFESFPRLDAAKDWDVPSEMDADLIGFWFFHTFAMQSFAFVWGVGLVMLYKDCFNNKPGRVGWILIRALYGVYLVHGVFVALYCRAIESIEFSTYIINIIVVTFLTVPSSWLVAIGLKLIPGVNRVL